MKGFKGNEFLMKFFKEYGYIMDQSQEDKTMKFYAKVIKNFLDEIFFVHGNTKKHKFICVTFYPL